MPIARGVAEQFEASEHSPELSPVIAPEASAEAVSPEIAALQATIAELRATNARQAAQLNELAGPVEWLALGACDRGGYSYETLRTWCATRVVASRREHGRVLANTRSLAAHLKRLGLAKAIKSA
jgi:hypothetical protein